MNPAHRPDLLDDAELSAVTGGLSQGAAQFEFLRRNGMQPFMGRDGKPKVTWAAINMRMAGSAPAARDADWTALNRKAG